MSTSRHTAPSEDCPSMVSSSRAKASNETSCPSAASARSSAHVRILWPLFAGSGKESARNSRRIVMPADLGCSDGRRGNQDQRSEEHTSELQSRGHLVCRLLLEKKTGL